ncbi:MAG TPA: adenylate/guanylate cyclase domain-containing protein [Anaerolineales bacterium]
MTSALPLSTLTFLFTDIEGSTRLWESHPEAMKLALARHDALLRAAVETNGGRLIKTTGDGIHAVFDTALGGACAALAGQQALRSEPWGMLAPSSLRVRMGLHTGEAESRAGDYFGGTLNRAARLMSLAHGGQVLLSQSASDLLREQLPPDTSLRDLGEHRLKDLIRPEHVFQLEHPSVEADFPPLQSLDAFPNNLPVQLTSFVGRERELAEARARLAPARLLTLIGPGGTGKTRLSLQLAAEVLPDYRDGVWLVELAPLSDPELIVQSIAALFHLRRQMEMPVEENLLNYLRAKQMLLILDNCEHMVEACARLADLFLRTSPGLKILASSREALGINGEAVFRVPSLSLPDQHHVTPETLSASESAQLFIERARAVDPKFTLSAKNAPAVAQICTRLDGIPLAIELAAGRSAVFSAEQIAARLGDRFKLLTGGSRAALPRQQTLRAMIDWSHETLPEDERALFRRLSVFAGGWTFEAAEAVCPDLEVLDLLTQLVNKSLVMAEDEGGGKRYRFLETIRQYARDKLLEAGEAEAVRTLHMQYFVRLADQAGPKMDTGEVMRWAPVLETEYDNMRVAFEWSLDHDVSAALGFVASLAYFWFQRGHGAEGIRWAEDALLRARDLPLPPDERQVRQQTLLRARALQSAAFLYYSQGDPRGALELGESCVALARQLGDARLLGTALAMACSSLALTGDVERAVAYAEESILLLRGLGDDLGLSMALGMMAQVMGIVKRDFKAADEYEQESLALLNRVQHPWSAAMGYFASGRSAMFRGDYATARERFAKCLPAFQQMGDPHRVCMIQSELAHMDRYEGRFEAAERSYRETILVWQKLGHRAAVAHQLECFAILAIRRQAYERAARLFGAAGALREKINIAMSPMERVEYEKELAAVRGAVGEEGFGSAWADGRSLSMEAAIDYALG